MVHKRILVWPDESPSAMKAMREGLTLAKEYGRSWMP
jgi:hypothetical protein